MDTLRQFVSAKQLCYIIDFSILLQKNLDLIVIHMYLIDYTSLY